MPEFLQYGFMHRAFAAGVVTALICPAIGVFLIPRRLSLIADTLAHVALAQNDRTAALAYVEEILAYLQIGSLAGADAPFRVYLTCYHVLQAHSDSRAPTILQLAHELLQTRAATIGDERLRRLFLENVPAHRELVIASTALSFEF